MLKCITTKRSEKNYSWLNFFNDENGISEYKTLSTIKIEFDFRRVLFGLWFFFGDFFECYGGFCRYRFLCYRVFFVLFVCHEQLLDCINAL